MKKLLAFLLAFGLLAVAPVAQDQFVPDKGQTPVTEDQDDPEKELKEKIKKYDDLLTDSVKYEGPFTLYTKTKDDKTDVFIELAPDELGKYWFLQATLRTGASPMGLQAGEPVNPGFQATDAFRFERRGERVWLFVPNLSWRWDERDPLRTAAERTFPEGVLESYKIEAEHPETNKIILKVTDLFNGTIFDLNQRIMMVLGRPYQLDRDKSGVGEIKAFPENLVVRADLFYTSSSGGGGPLAELMALLGMSAKSHLADQRSLPLSVTYLIYPQRENGYMPRYADPRVGYFTQDFYDHMRFMNRDRTTRLINRWHLEKKDPAAAMSEPVNPIVWYIDDSVPEKWRDACAEGILRWNKAFEAIGYKNVIQVKMKPADADWDHADMRHNVLRFVTSENAGYAIALFRTDPFTGEIVNAAISVDANITQVSGLEYAMLTEPAREPVAQSLARLVRTPEDDHRDHSDAIGPAWQKFECNLLEGKLMSANFGWMALEMLDLAGTSINRDDYIREFIADIVSHEMGHCLGLRHNFAGSTYLSAEDLADPEVTGKKGVSASVMDYVPVNMFAVKNGRGHYYSRTIGAYDVFAVQYGYKDVHGATPLEQFSHLLHVAAKGGLPGHRFMTDEDADGYDPFAVRFDNTRNPLDDVEVTIGVAKRLLSTADQRYPQPGRPYMDLVRAVNMTLRQTTIQSLTASRFVGGVEGNRNYRGDVNERPTLAPVDPAMQRKAIQIITRELFAEDSFKLSERMLLNLAGDYNSGSVSDAPIRDVISSMQIMVLSSLLSADTTGRIVNNQFKLANRPDKFTLAELYSTVIGKVFSEVGTGRQIGTLRRDLQRFTVEGLTAKALSRPGQIPEDDRMLAWDNLRRLHARLDKATSTDEMTAMHMRDLKHRIDRAMNSVVTNGR